MANETVLFKRGDSATITSTPVTDGQILFDTSGNGKMYLDNGTDRLEMGGAIIVDASLSKTSTNAVQNKAVTGNILNSLAEVSAATQQNTIAGALALKEVNSSLTNENAETFNFGVKDGVRGFYTNPSRADDSFVPFNNFPIKEIIQPILLGNGGTVTLIKEDGTYYVDVHADYSVSDYFSNTTFSYPYSATVKKSGYYGMCDLNGNLGVSYYEAGSTLTGNNNGVNCLTYFCAYGESYNI